MYTEDELLALSGLQHLSFCSRQWALIHLENLWADNFDTVHGNLFHEHAHLSGYSIKKNVLSERSMSLICYRLGLSGYADIVEFIEDDTGGFTNNGKTYTIIPIEYKVGKPKVEDWDRIQVCAQALCLEEMFSCNITEGALFYGKTRRRERLMLDQNIRDKVESLSVLMHEIFMSQKTPCVQKNSNCKRCSLIDICLPESHSNDPVMYWQKEGLTFIEG